MNASASDPFDKIPVIDIDADNFPKLWTCLKTAVSTATYIAVDCELSGLGRTRLLHKVDVEERYRMISTIAQSRGIVSLGLCCLKQMPYNSATTGGSKTFLAQTFNLLTLCSPNFVNDVAALEFLIHHGFDFNRQISKGIRYTPPSSSEETNASEVSSPSLSSLFDLLVANRKARLIFHNGFIDLVFLYHAFYATLPKKLGTLLADLSQMFPGGIYDTKFLAGNSWNLNATFLEYVFRKAQLESRRRRTAREPHIALMFPAYKEGTPFVDYHSCGLKTDFSSSINGKSTPACPAYAAVGNCRRVLDGCPLSHDIDVVFRDEELAAQKKRKRKRDVEAAPSVQVIESASETPPSVDGTHEDHPAVERTRGHRASFDAFMTAFALLGNSSSVADLSKEGANKVYLSGKTFPLLIQQSAYSAVSSGHREAIARIRSADLT